MRSTVPSQSAAPPTRARTGSWIHPIERPQTLIGPTTLQVFQQQVELNADSWNDPTRAHLTRYNLHYFDDLVARDAERRHTWQRGLIARWIKENPPGQGAGWEPYPLSMRIVNWVKWTLAGNKLQQTELNSLAFQARSLQRQLEYHLLGNHLWANAKALIFAGAFFSGPEADSWLDRGTRLLNREIAEQVLRDGGHFELSPMYHSILLEDLLDLVNLSRAFGLRSSNPWPTTIQEMRHWLRAMCHPDGEFSFFNDAAFGVASTPQQIDDFATRLGLPPIRLPDRRVIQLADSGYVRVQFPEHVLLIDVAEIGPSYQPGHAHADTLSFEWSLNRQRAFVNSGTSCYGTSAERERQRGTAAHNTVIVDQLNSSEVWSGFRVARRAHPFDLGIQESDDRVVVTCSHSGYQRLPGRVTHTRRWEIQASSFSVHDVVSQPFNSAVLRLHFHPDWSVVEKKSGVFSATTATQQQVDVTVDGTSQLEQGSYHPGFEQSIPNFVIASQLDSEGAKTQVRWSPGGVEVRS